MILIQVVREEVGRKESCPLHGHGRKTRLGSGSPMTAGGPSCKPGGDHRVLTGGEIGNPAGSAVGGAAESAAETAESMPVGLPAGSSAGAPALQHVDPTKARHPGRPKSPLCLPGWGAQKQQPPPGGDLALQGWLPRILTLPSWTHQALKHQQTDPGPLQLNCL